MIKSIYMSGEQISDIKLKSPLKKNQYLEERKKVDINTLLNKVRANKKKEQIESNVFFGLVTVVVITTGIIISL